ncbi:MAG: TylF/MycF/NovP-related O-methyltransferase [Thermostichus sp. HHBFW_bins_43]
MNSSIIVTAADSKFFDLVQGTILSVRDKPQGRSVDIGFFDLGCTPEELRWLSTQVNHIVEPRWDYDFPGIDKAPLFLKGLLARPFLPNYFPGYEIYIWLDADAWVQDWLAVDLLVRGATKEKLTIVPEIDRGNKLLYGPKEHLHQLQDAYAFYFPDDDIQELHTYPLLNAGVFSLHRNSKHWHFWDRRLRQALIRPPSILTDQLALNVSVFLDGLFEETELLPAYCNWTCHYGFPKWDPKRNLLVEPYLPHKPIGILHLTSTSKKAGKYIIRTTEEKEIEISLRYSQSRLSRNPVKYDYISLGFQEIHLDSAFPNMQIGNVDACPWPYLRREIPHLWYVDQRNPTIGFVSRDEAHILYNNALQFKGQPALEIGCWMGWSAAHLASAGVILDVVDPILSQSIAYESVDQSLTLAGIRSNVTLYPGTSPEKVEEIAQAQNRRWPLIFIDGDHDHPGPLQDAQVAEKYAAEDALILFHDLTSPDVAEGLHYFRDRGWNTMIYQTMQIMGVAWRGSVQPVEHSPDPSVQWTLPKHLEGYRVSGLELQSLLAVIRPFTLLSLERLSTLYSLAKKICQEDIPGNFVECGVYKGGSSALLAWVVKNFSRRPRRVYSFDTFSGMPDPSDMDRHQGIPANDTGFGVGTLQAPIAENLEQVCKDLGVWELVTPVAGLFEDTLPVYREEIGEIALLHADGDWYSSTMDIFRNLYGQVSSQGFIQIDDYGHWEGCRQAVHDFEQEIKTFFQIHTIDYTGVWVGLRENLPILSAEDSDPSTPGIRLSQINLVLFPDWDPEPETIIAELEPLLEHILLSDNPQDFALIISAELDSEVAESVLEMAAANVALKLMEQGHELSVEPYISLVKTLNAHQWERLLSRLTHHYPLTHERLPAGIQPALSQLPRFGLPEDPTK